MNVQDLSYYFDASMKDAMDRGGVGRKNGQLLQLREKMLQLDDSQFELAMRTMENMVQKPLEIEGNRRRETAGIKRDARELYSEAKTGLATGSAKDKKELKLSVV